MHLLNQLASVRAGLSAHSCAPSATVGAEGDDALASLLDSGPFLPSGSIDSCAPTAKALWDFAREIESTDMLLLHFGRVIVGEPPQPAAACSDDDAEAKIELNQDDFEPWRDDEPCETPSPPRPQVPLAPVIPPESPWSGEYYLWARLAQLATGDALGWSRAMRVDSFDVLCSMHHQVGSVHDRRDLLANDVRFCSLSHRALPLTSYRTRARALAPVTCVRRADWLAKRACRSFEWPWSSERRCAAGHMCTAPTRHCLCGSADRSTSLLTREPLHKAATRTTKVATELQFVSCRQAIVGSRAR